MTIFDSIQIEKNVADTIVLSRVVPNFSCQLRLMQGVLAEAGVYIQRWAPRRFLLGMSTVDLLSLAASPLDKLSIILMALRDVPETQRYVGMSESERQLSERYLQLLDAYLGFWH